MLPSSMGQGYLRDYEQSWQEELVTLCVRVAMVDRFGCQAEMGYLLESLECTISFARCLLF